MSHTTVLGLYPGDRFERIEEFHNSWGSAPVVWDALAERHLGLGMKLSGNVAHQLWILWKHLGVPQAHRAVLMMTFDYGMVLRCYYARAAADIRAFLADFPPQDGYANHWPRIAEIYESSPAYPAIGMHCTSVSENPWEVPYNEERDEYDQFDWSKAIDIYAELDAIEPYAAHERARRAKETP